MSSAATPLSAFSSDDEGGPSDMRRWSEPRDHAPRLSLSIPVSEEGILPAPVDILNERLPPERQPLSLSPSSSYTNLLSPEGALSPKTGMPKLTVDVPSTGGLIYRSAHLRALAMLEVNTPPTSGELPLSPSAATFGDGRREETTAQPTSALVSPPPYRPSKARRLSLPPDSLAPAATAPTGRRRGSSSSVAAADGHTMQGAEGGSHDSASSEESEEARPTLFRSGRAPTLSRVSVSAVPVSGAMTISVSSSPPSDVGFGAMDCSLATSLSPSFSSATSQGEVECYSASAFDKPLASPLRLSPRPARGEWIQKSAPSSVRVRTRTIRTPTSQATIARSEHVSPRPLASAAASIVYGNAAHSSARFHQPPRVPTYQSAAVKKGIKPQLLTVPRASFSAPHAAHSQFRHLAQPPQPPTPAIAAVVAVHRKRRRPEFSPPAVATSFFAKHQDAVAVGDRSPGSAAVVDGRSGSESETEDDTPIAAPLSALTLLDKHNAPPSSKR